MSQRTEIVTVSGTAYRVVEPTVSDWLLVCDLEPTERMLALVERCVVLDASAAPAFDSREKLLAAPASLLMALDSRLGELLAFDVPDPT